jgi:NAD(P)H dehydrogenase (quinone)
MKVLIVIGHPNSNSFNHALANVCKEQIIKNGHTVFFHDLYKEQFNPVLNPENNLQDDDITQYCSELKESNGIIIIHPNWWGQPPAIIKGWIDRVFIPEIAYTFVEDSNNNHIQKGLLQAQTALVLNTSNTAEELEDQIYKDPLETIWKNRVFQFCGISNFKRLNYRVIKDSNIEQRTVWLTDLQQLIDSYFPKTQNK